MSEKTRPKEQAFSLEQWSRHFGVTRDPFSSEAPFFSGGQRQDSLDNLRHLVHFSDHIVLVTGDKGCGKTYLLEKLTDYEKEALKIIWLRPGLLEGQSSLILHMAKAAGVAVHKSDTVNAIVKRIVETCDSRFSHGLRTLFIIDDAHELSDESLELLATSFNPRHSGSFGLVLLAQQQVVEQIRRLFPGAEKQPFHQVQLRAFNQAESADYVIHRMQQAGWGGNPELAPKDLAKLHELGKGVPGRINRIAASLLLAGPVEAKTRRIRPRQLSYLFTGLVFSALVLAVVVVSLQYMESPDPEMKPAISDRLSVELPSPLTGNEIPDSAIFADAAAESASRREVPDSEETEKSQEVVSTASPDMPVPEAADTAPASAERVVPAVEEGASPTLAASSVEDDLATDVVASGSETGSSRVADKKDDSTLSASPELVQEEAFDQNMVQEEKSSSPVESGSPSVVASEPESGVGAAETYQRDASWLRSQPKGSWTVQVLGSLSESAATQYIGELKSKEGFFYVKSTYQGKDWYVVLHGIYSGKDEARKGLATLPAKIRDAGAWIRSVSGLQVASQD